MGRKPANGGPDPFPAGLRVLVVDDDPTCLIILEKMLSTCKYLVTKTNRAEVALNLLRENKNGFDVVISDVHMPDMDGFKLLEHVGYEMDLPVIMMSADDSNNVVMKGVTHGACDYLIKPVRIEALRNIWQHVVRKKKNEWREVEQSSSWDEGERQQKQDDAPASSSANEGSWKSSKRKHDDEDVDEKDDTTALKKPRVVWSVDLHQQFVAAVNQLGVEKAVPKKILELMNVPGLTRENVASHLQKYRLYLKRMTQQYGELNSSFMPQDAGFSAMSSIGGFQALHASGQLSAQTMAAYTRLPPMNPSMSMPFVDQRNLFSFDNSKPRFGDTNQQQLSNVNKPMNLLHGIPTTLEPKQLAGLNQSAQNMGNVNMQGNVSSSYQSSSRVKMAPQLTKGKHLNESIDGHVSQIQPMRSNGATSVGYNSVPHAGSVVNYSMGQIPDISGNIFPLGSTPGLTTKTSKGLNREENYVNTTPVEGYVKSYNDWPMQNPNMSFGSSSQHTSGMNAIPSSINPYISSQKPDQNGVSITGKTMLATGLGNQHPRMQNINHNGFLADSTSRVKAENQSSGPNLFSEHYSQQDLTCALLKQ